MFKKYIATIGLTLALAAPALADTTYQTLPFSQDWTNTNLITADNDWSGVPGIIGYRGDTLSSSTATDPAATLTDGSGTPINVLANQTTPGTSGGIVEFDGIPNPVVAFQGSGTADSPHLVFYINTTGKTSINVSYKLREIDTDNAPQKVALQYRVGETGNFTNVPGGYVIDASNGAGLETPVSVTLPAAVDNQAQVQIRVMTNDAVGSDSFIGVDDISITDNAAASPSLTVSTTDLGSFGNVWPVPGVSAAKSLDVSGANLTGNVVITPPAGFEVKKTADPTYSSSISLAPASGSVALTNIEIHSKFATASQSVLFEGHVVFSTAGTPDKNVKVLATANDNTGLYMYDEVDFPAGDLTTGTSWLQFQAATGTYTTSSVHVLPGSLTFATLGRSATLGNKIQALGQPSNGQGVVAPFFPIADGANYSSFLLNVPTGGANVSATNPQLTGFREGSGTFTRSALYMMAGTSAATYRLGHSFYAFANAFPVGVDLNVNQTYLIVVKYSFNGAADDESKLFVFAASDPFPTTEPAVAFQTVTKQGTETDSSSYLSGFVVRQQNFGQPWEAQIDAVRAGGTWASVVPPVGASVTDWQLF